MSTRPDPDIVIASWLQDEARDGASDRLLAATRRQLESTHQRRALWPARRLGTMNIPIRVAIAVAAVAVVAVVAMNVLPRPSGIGAPGVSAGPSAGSSPTLSQPPLPLTLQEGPLAAGTYLTNAIDGVRLTFRVPDRWEGYGAKGLAPIDTGLGAPDGMALLFLRVGGLYSDPCNGTKGDIVVGPSVDDLANALARQTTYNPSTPTEITIDGYSGKAIDLQLPSDVDFSKCTNNGGDPTVPTGVGGYFVWESAVSGGPNVYAQGPGDRFHVRILDIAGVRAVILTQDFPGTSAADVTELQAIVDSIRIEP
jgi:hypothetical protein